MLKTSGTAYSIKCLAPITMEFKMAGGINTVVSFRLFSAYHIAPTLVAVWQLWLIHFVFLTSCCCDAQ